VKTLFWAYVAIFVLTILLLIGSAVAALVGEKAVGLPMFGSFLICSAILFTMRRVLERKLQHG
jgi:hypothetical protein